MTTCGGLLLLFAFVQLEKKRRAHPIAHHLLKHYCCSIKVISIAQYPLKHYWCIIKENQHSTETNLSLRMVTTLFKLSFCLPLALSDMIIATNFQPYGITLSISNRENRIVSSSSASTPFICLNERRLQYIYIHA